ncbi:HEAT repeat domain-containing protein [Undibacterium pigrum]|uniref:HEAT repeat protein n=1 Tax=Undibacterium pigrum TaxID=401470 RepID=A0A318J4E0_9BURK|nr:HEAT repeat domain-containing protein [Undibacterium pigrum]PXX42638.1 hypothetical protein DFR42_105296 [Undibacterium pigrum]
MDINFHHRIQLLFKRENTVPASRLSRSDVKMHADYFMIEDSAFYEAFLDWRTGATIDSSKIASLSAQTAVYHLRHRDGYVREFCLRVLIAQEQPSAFSAIVNRLNDYVSGIRELAELTMQDWLGKLAAAEIITALPDIYALRKQSRSNAEKIMESVVTRLSSPDNHAMILTGLTSDQHQIRKLCWQLALRLFDWTPLEKVMQAIATRDVLVTMAASPEVANLADDDVLMLYGMLNKINSMHLRRMVLLTTRQRQLRPTDEVLALALWDNSYTVRTMARTWAGKEAEKLSVAYREMLANTPFVRKKLLALEGIRQQKSASSLELVASLLKDEHPSLRKAALQTACKIDPSSLPVYLHACLNDSSMTVFKQCLQIAINSGDLLEFTALEQLARHKQADAVFFLHILDYAVHITPWYSLHIASLTELADDQVKTTIKRALHSFLYHWSRRTIYGQPSSLQYHAIMHWLTPDKLDSLKQVGSELRFALDAEMSRQATARNK